MAITLLRQDTQIRNSDLYDDTITPTEAAFETNPADIETDLNNIRSAVKTMIGKTNWWDVADRSMEGLDTDLADMEGKKILCLTHVLTNVTVGGSDNFVTLVAASSETPSVVSAVALTQNGAVCAQLPGAVGTHSLVEIAGQNALAPKNLVFVRDASTKDAITSGGQEIFGLLQLESTGTDGTAFDDAADQAQISFVIQSGDDLIACPAVDIQGKTIEYAYAQRTTLDALPEDCAFPGVKFADRTSAASDVSRKNAYDNQGTTPVELANNADLDLGAGIQWAIRDAADADLFNLTENSTGSATTLTIGTDVDVYQNNAVDVDFDQGITVDEGGTAINLGVTAGQIDAGAALTVATVGSFDLSLVSGQEMFFDDVNQTGSTWAQTGGVKLSETTAEWDAYETAFGGEVSLLNAIVQAKNTSARRRVCSVMTANVNADVDVSGPSDDNNMDTDLGDLSAGTFVDDYDIYLNGQYMRLGANSGANFDVYPGTSLANGQLKFERKLKTGDTICIVDLAV